MSNPAVVPTSKPGSFGICIAFNQAWNTVSPTWTRLDDQDVPIWTARAASPHNTNCVSAFTTDRGRTYELDKTQTGTATITLMDPNGLFDPTNAASPFYGLIVPNLQAKISVQNPANLQFYDIFSGFIESWGPWTMDPAEQLMTVTISLVDGFEILTQTQLPVEATGTTTLIGIASGTACQTRINGLLDVADWPDDGLPPTTSQWRKVNTGNVFLQPTVYDPETQLLSCIQDCADAEFPGVANFFMSKMGAATFYGRYPRFQPTNYPEDVNFWQVADFPGLAPANGAALISDIQWQMDSKNLINACLCYPYGIAQSEIQNQYVTNASSIAQYGTRTLSLTDLIVDGQPAGAGISPQPAADRNDTCLFYAQYYVQNYFQPALRISRLQFGPRPTGDSQTQQFLTGVEIGDLLTVYTSDPGGGGFSKGTGSPLVSFPSQFFVEGIHNQVTPGLGVLKNWVMTLDVSPRAWFTTATWAS